MLYVNPTETDHKYQTESTDLAGAPLVFRVHCFFTYSAKNVALAPSANEDQLLFVLGIHKHLK